MSVTTASSPLLLVASQLPLEPGEENEVARPRSVEYCGCSISWICLVTILWNIMEPTLSGRHSQPFLLQNLHEPAQGLHNIIQVHRGPPPVVRSPWSRIWCRSEKSNATCLVLAAWALALKARLILLQPLFYLLLRLGSV
jgi:hypothetical protein